MDKSNPYGLRIPKNGSTHIYDFWVDGQRYSKSTRKARQGEALKVAARVRAEAEGTVVRTSAPRLPEMPLREVFGRYYNERVTGLAQADNVLGQLDRAAKALGPDVLLSQLTLNDLLNYQSGLRKQGFVARRLR